MTVFRIAYGEQKKEVEDAQSTPDVRSIASDQDGIATRPLERRNGVEQR